MAGEQRTPMGQPSLAIPVEVEAGQGDGQTADFNPQGGVDHGVVDASQGLTADITNDGATINREDEGAGEGEDHRELVQEGEQTEPMPDFNPEDPTSVQTFESRFTTNDGGYNMETLSQDFFANNGQGLSEGTYKWLESRGIDRTTAKAVEAGQLALANQGSNAVFTRVGGEAQYRAAIDWAKGGGYTPAQRKAYNDALNAGGERANDAIDALMARARKANPGGFRVPPVRQTPGRSAANAGGGGSPASTAVEKYASYADYSRDLRRARKENNQALFDLTRRRGKASGFY